MLYWSYENDSKCDEEVTFQIFYRSTSVDHLVNTCWVYSRAKGANSGKARLFGREFGAKKASWARGHAFWRAMVAKFEKFNHF